MRLLRAPIADLADRGYQPHGVIHVGVNDGEELPWYFHMGVDPVLGFEPLPDVYEQTALAFHAHQSAGRLLLVNVALGERDGDAVMNVPLHAHAPYALDTPSASLLRLKPERAAAIGWLVTETQTRPVKVWRFDTWLGKQYEAYERTLMGLDGAQAAAMARYNTLVIDAQGMTLQVLRGFGRWLSRLRYLQLELSALPIYEGEANALTVEEYVEHFGFRRITPFVPHGDVLFVKS